MTRDEHIAFCKKCTNRKMDMQQGLLCGITDKVADFEGDCPNFNRDQEVLDTPQIEPEPERGFMLPKEVLASESEEILQKARSHQDLTFAIIGGVIAALVSAIIWAAVTVSSGYQIGYMAVAVGLIVGFAVRYFGAGIDGVYGIIGAFMALLGCALGNIFSQIGFLAEDQGLGIMETLALVDLTLIPDVMMETFSGMDLFFYGLAIYEGYKFAFRPITQEMIRTEDFTPTGARWRLPLAGASVVLIGILLFSVKSGADGEKTFYYESGETMSNGVISNGLEEGSWSYYHENGELMLLAEYSLGEMDGMWLWYNEEGDLQKEENYVKGLMHGSGVYYHHTGVPSDSGNFEYGRKNGLWINRNEQGNLLASGAYFRDKQAGVWEYYHDNGILQSRGSYESDELNGDWTFWDSTGAKLVEQTFLEEGYLINNSWDPKGNQTVVMGEGILKNYFDNGQISETGTVHAGKMTGTWMEYYEDGKLKTKGVHEEHQYTLAEAWSEQGDQLIIDGEGHYKWYDPITEVLLLSGLYEHGLKTGSWEIYHESGEIFQTVTYEKGKMHGEAISYFETGEIQSEGFYSNDKRDGDWIWYNANGIKESAVSYENGKKEGDQFFWSLTGGEAKIESYQDGELIKEEIR